MASSVNATLCECNRVSAEVGEAAEEFGMDTLAIERSCEGEGER